MIMGNVLITVSSIVVLPGVAVRYCKYIAFLAHTGNAHRIIGWIQDHAEYVAHQTTCVPEADHAFVASFYLAVTRGWCRRTLATDELGTATRHVQRATGFLCNQEEERSEP